MIRLCSTGTPEQPVHLPSLLPPGLTDVWLGVRCLVGLRDAVAHHGGFAPDSSAQQAQKWYEDVAELMTVVRAVEPLCDPRDHLAQSAREMTRLVLAKVVDDAIADAHWAMRRLCGVCALSASLTGRAGRGRLPVVAGLQALGDDRQGPLARGQRARERLGSRLVSSAALHTNIVGRCQEHVH